MRIGVLAYEGCLAAEIFVFTDLLRIANRVARETGAATEDPFRVSVIAASAEPVAAAGGFPVGATRWHHRFDRLIVPGFELVPSEDVAARLHSLQRETTFLRVSAERGTRVASVCVGAFLLGEAGLLDGRRATTSWLFASRLARRYPRATVCPEALIVTDGTVTTTAAFSAALDLATALVREHLGDDIARATARITLVAENRTSQAPHIVDAMLPSQRGPFADGVAAWLVEHLAEPYDLGRLADALHVSTRTLLRRFRAETGESPLDFLRRARVRVARNLLETTDLPLARVIERVGYRDAGTFRRLFVEQVGMNPADYRRKFHGDASSVAMQPPMVAMPPLPVAAGPGQTDRTTIDRSRRTPVPQRSLHEDDPLDDFERRSIEENGVTKTVYVAGSGPAVIVMPEMPGISPHVARFGRWVRDAGFTVYLPSLFGRDGAVPGVEEGVAVLRRACVSAEFRALGADGTTPAVAWLRALARRAHGECGGPGVGAIGMCFTGNFALSMMLEPAMLAPVLSQPSLPLDDPDGIDSGPEELASVRKRLETDDLTVLAYRFQGDKFCRAQRFAAYERALGDRFEARILPDSAANPETSPFFEHVIASPHSVVTAHLIDEAGQPTVAARDEILTFLAMRLRD